MPKKEISNDEFFKKYEAYEKESIEDFIKRYSSTERELKETIAYLIAHRQAMRDAEIEKLETEAANLLKKLKKIELEKMLELQEGSLPSRAVFLGFFKCRDSLYGCPHVCPSL